MVKSANTEGNPYHDEEGKFTSAGDSGVKKISLKGGVDLNALKTEIDKKVNPLKYDIEMPKDLSEAEKQGNALISSSRNSVGYDSKTSVEVAFELNKALQSVARDFPKIFKGNDLFVYGTENKNTLMKNPRDIVNVVIEKLKEPVFAKRIADMGLDEHDLHSLYLDLSTRAYDFMEGYNKGNFRNRSVGGSTGFFTGQSLMNGSVTVGASVKMNSWLSRSKEEYDKYIASGVKYGNFKSYGDKSGAYYASVHELGHVVFQNLRDLMDNKERMNVNTLTSNWINLAKNGEISGYAATSQHEQVAEAFADYYCNGDNASEHNKKIMSYLINYYGGKYNG